MVACVSAAFGGMKVKCPTLKDLNKGMVVKRRRKGLSGNVPYYNVERKELAERVDKIVIYGVDGKR